LIVMNSCMNKRSSGAVIPKPPTSFGDLSRKYRSLAHAVGLNRRALSVGTDS
jgi:hypothetical protein